PTSVQMISSLEHPFGWRNRAVDLDDVAQTTPETALQEHDGSSSVLADGLNFVALQFVAGYCTVADLVTLLQLHGMLLIGKRRLCGASRPRYARTCRTGAS